ncbi:hypothetical protein D3C76_1671480 [compost metagenome]
MDRLGTDHRIDLAGAKLPGGGNDDGRHRRLGADPGVTQQWIEGAHQQQGERRRPRDEDIEDGDQ